MHLLYKMPPLIRYTFTMVHHQNLSELGGTKLLIRVHLI